MTPDPGRVLRFDGELGVREAGEFLVLERAVCRRLAKLFVERALTLEQVVDQLRSGELRP